MISHVALYWAALFAFLLHLPHVWWFDNYNKGFQQALTKLKTGSYLRIDSTCFVLVLLKQAPVQRDMEDSTSAQPATTLPTEFSVEHLELFISSFSNKRNTNLLTNSLATTLQVWNNPLRPTNATTPRDFAADCLQSKV
jgi:hypothetical protein